MTPRPGQSEHGAGDGANGFPWSDGTAEHRQRRGL